MSDTAAVLELLEHGELSVRGRLLDASNLALLGSVRNEGACLDVVHKPSAGEQPLWDFPTGGLAERERAAWLVSDAGGWDVVPPTVLRTGPFGRGTVQQWIGSTQQPSPSPVRVVGDDEVPEGHLVVLEGEDERGDPVLVTHPDDGACAAVAVFDAVINNSDRKGGHLLEHAGHLWGIDHGVSFHVEDKLRTVLWGWVGEPLPPVEVARLEGLHAWLDEDPAAEELDVLLTVAEMEALRRRVERLLATGTFPLPPPNWPSVPWPPM